MREGDIVRKQDYKWILENAAYKCDGVVTLNGVELTLDTYLSLPEYGKITSISDLGVRINGVDQWIPSITFKPINSFMSEKEEKFHIINTYFNNMDDIDRMEWLDKKEHELLEEFPKDLDIEDILIENKNLKDEVEKLESKLLGEI